MLIALLTAIASISCSHDKDDLCPVPSDKGFVNIQLRTNEVPVRAAEADNEIESAVDHIDVLIYEYKDGTFNHFHHERIHISGSPSSVMPLKKTRRDFEAGGQYKVIVIANSTLPEINFNGIGYHALLDLEQTDENIHFTGIDASDGDYVTIPETFLMDGVAYTSATEPDMPGNVVINSGNTDNDLTLNVTLRRAAAKFVIKFIPGEDVEFRSDLMAQSHGYMFRNMPYRTMVVTSEDKYPGKGSVPYWKSTSISQSPYFRLFEEDGKTCLEITAYAYAHTWETDKFFEKGTSLVVMLPIVYDDNEHINNYYQIAINKNESGRHYIRRNTYYELRVRVNAPGAEDYTVPEQLKDILYFTEPWKEKELEINGESPIAYLNVNKNNLFMYNVADDNESLIFSSSSPVSITVKEAYYKNKYDNKINLTESEKSEWLEVSTATDATSGEISIHSTLPENNTIRYITLEIRNNEGITETINIEQYPLIYITNGLPWYSYREDYYYRTAGGHLFSDNIDTKLTDGDAPSTYRYQGDHIASVYKVERVDVANKTARYTYSNNKSYSQNGVGYGFTASKYRGKKSGNKYEIMYYYFSYSKKNWSMVTKDICETNNVRNYHIRMMASSGDYTIGRPRLDEHGYTADDEENSKLVSPSFVIASRLGAMQTNYGGLSKLSNEEKLVVFADHCKNYVEVDDVNDDAMDPVITYDNWRLPTKAELEIIIERQGTKNQDADAIDYLLNGAWYMSASGPVFNNKYDPNSSNPDNTNQVAIRCVRDAF